MAARRILLIDDEPDLLAALALRLTAAGFQCETANGSYEGLEKAQADPPDLIMTDLSMPGMDGYELCRRLKADPQTAAVPIIMLTASIPENEIASQAQELGIERLLYKMVESKELISTVREVFTTMEGPNP